MIKILINIVDVGSNTIRFGEYSLENNTIHKKRDILENASLASYVQNGVMNMKGIDLLNKSLKKLLFNKNLDEVKIIATASLRKCKNKDLILAECLKEGFNIEIISGEDESKFSFLGASIDIKKTKFKDGLFLDIGGGSSEILFFYDYVNIKECFSCDFGSMSIYKDLFYNDFDEDFKNNVLSYLNTKIKNYSLTKNDVDICFLSGGTGETFELVFKRLKSLDNKDVNFDNYVYIKEDIQYVINAIKKNIFNIKEYIKDISEKRLLTIIPGLLILNFMLSYFNINTFLITTFGVREGYILNNTL